jgi:hypothetical protein
MRSAAHARAAEQRNSMKHANRIRRIGGLAVGLGIGAVLAATPWVASADPFVPFDPNNIAISIDGITLFQEGTATATSGTGDFAFADGAFSHAGATGSIGDVAFADGFNSEAEAALGNFDDATAVGNHSFADASGGNNDVASVYDFTGGPGSTATASDGNSDFATVYDFFGNLGSHADASIGSNDIAAVFADGSNADSGMGSNDIAAVFVDMLTGVAQGGDGMITILPWF